MIGRAGEGRIHDHQIEGFVRDRQVQLVQTLNPLHPQAAHLQPVGSQHWLDQILAEKVQGTQIHLARRQAAAAG